MNVPVSTYSAKTLLSELLTPEIFVVLLIRLRVAAQFDPGSMPEDWRAGLRAAGVAREGIDAFDMLMHLFGSILRLPLDVRSLRCGGLGQGEALLLQTISLLQHSRNEEAEAILGQWLPPGMSRIAMQQATRFGRALTSVHLVIPMRHCEAAHLDFSRRPTPDRGVALIH